MTVAETRYTSVQVTELAGCTYRQLDSWCREGVFGPHYTEPVGSGRRRSFSAVEVTIARACGEASRFLQHAFGSQGAGSVDVYRDIARQVRVGRTLVRLDLGPSTPGVSLTLVIDTEASR